MDDFDNFFNEAVPASKEATNQPESFDTFFETCVKNPAHSKLVSHTVDKKRKDGPKRLSFYQSFCSQLCYMWLTVQIVMFCRAKKILLQIISKDENGKPVRCH